ncbi:related to oligopeptidase [Desulfotalea psychrophila LSv54]|uniref:Related to oligopeptidase n=2 Tax=Desulfotalea psychrophila TaxID=84980 RepID=Q6ANA3_DESPS|nr:related to oligopeptidase [Desulfotalea psychrophila LSv54]
MKFTVLNIPHQPKEQYMESSTLNKNLQTTDIIWNLQDLYQSPNDPQIETDLNWCSGEAIALREEWSGKIATISPADLALLVARLEALDCRFTKLGTYSFLNFTTQMDNSTAGALDQRVHEQYSRSSAEIVFFELEWTHLSSKRIDQLLTAPEIAFYRHYLEALNKNRPHMLSEKEEQLLQEKEITGRSSWTTLFEKVFAHLKFGETRRSEEEVLTELYSEHRETRMHAALEMTEGLQSQLHILTHIFNTLAAEKMVTDRIRRYDGWLSSMNIANELEESTVDALVDAVTNRYDIVEKYYNIKREILGLEELYDYDRYAPLPHLPTGTTSWQECKEIVLSSFAEFSPKMAEIAGEFFAKGWIHAPIQDTKRGGAFAHPCVPEVHPYVLVNYTGNIRDISTVAHELGHGVHQVLAAGQGHFNSDTPLPLAETASVFAELLVFKAQLKLLSSPEEKKALICQKLESIFATVFRQTAMNRFEDSMHRGRREKGELSDEELSQFWIDSQQAMFGDSVQLTSNYRIWWSYIPHFLATPGYVYSYAFGELLVLALYGIYQTEGEAFVAKYLELLSAGGSSSPYDLLKPFGFDLNDPAFWQKGLGVIEEMVESL